MKVLHIGLMVNGRDEGLSAAFRKRFGGDYLELPVTEGLEHKVSAMKFEADLVFLQIHSERIGNKDTLWILTPILSAQQERGAFVINWNGDIRNLTPPWMKRISPYVDVTAFSNERDIANFPADADFLQIGIDPVTFKDWQKPKTVDVVFMGNNYGSQFPLGNLRRQLCAELRRYNAQVYGNYPGAVRSLNPDPKNPFPVQSQESQIYSGAKIAINMSHYKVGRYTSDRMFRAMGSGPMVLSHYYPGIEKDFEIGVHLDVFRTFPEMHEKINYYLENEAERAAIASMGYEHVHKNFTYDNMVENILKIYEDRKGRN